jgi:hypothetical protein
MAFCILLFYSGFDRKYDEVSLEFFILIGGLTIFLDILLTKECKISIWAGYIIIWFVCIWCIGLLQVNRFH